MKIFSSNEFKVLTDYKIDGNDIYLDCRYYLGDYFKKANRALFKKEIKINKEKNIFDLIISSMEDYHSPTKPRTSSAQFKLDMPPLISIETFDYKSPIMINNSDFAIGSPEQELLKYIKELIRICDYCYPNEGFVISHNVHVFNIGTKSPPSKVQLYIDIVPGKTLSLFYPTDCSKYQYISKRFSIDTNGVVNVGICSNAEQYISLFQDYIYPTIENNLVNRILEICKESEQYYSSKKVIQMTKQLFEDFGIHTEIGFDIICMNSQIKENNNQQRKELVWIP